MSFYPTFNVRAARPAYWLTRLLAIALLVMLAACSFDDSDDPVVQNPDTEQPGTTPDDPSTTPDDPVPDPGTGPGTDPGTNPATEDPAPTTPDAAGFVLVDSGQRFAVVEGSGAVQIPVSILRGEDQARRIKLSLQPADALSGRNLAFALDDARLAIDESATFIEISLAIATAPLLPHERTLTLTATDDTTTISVPVRLDVMPVQAPDVYLLVGQSNMEGFSEVDAKDDGPGGQDEPHPRILQLNVTANDSQNFSSPDDFTNPDKNIAFPRFSQAQDPLHRSFDPSINGKKGERIGLGLSFAKAALPNTTQDIVLVPAAWAGTGFCDNELGELAWNPVSVPDNSNLGGTGLYDRAITRVDVALEETGGILRGILWHQGEADATALRCSTVYEKNLKKMIEAFRTDIREDARGSAARGAQSSIPFVLGTMSRGDDPRGEFSIFDEPKTEVDLVHRSISSEMAYTALSNHDDLIPPAYDCGEGFCIHFGADAYREMGRRYYQRLQAIVQSE